MNAVSDAFRSARIHARQLMAASDDAGLRWLETTITDVALAYAARAVRVVPFTQRQEARVGADWVWWWVDSSGSYGMLVQAKRVTIVGSVWKFGFDYKVRTTGEIQRHLLIKSATAMDLAPVYALYLGTPDYRERVPCSTNHRSGYCVECVKRTISLMPALLAEIVIVNDAWSTYERSVALEDLWKPSRGQPHLIPALDRKTSPKLRQFLKTPQNGARAIVRSMIDPILAARAGAFSDSPAHLVNAPTGRHDALPRVFEELPSDEGHWDVNYFEQVVGPLRQVPPAYVLEILSGEGDEARLATIMP